MNGNQYRAAESPRLTQSGVAVEKLFSGDFDNETRS
jgi:hypothetical protein